MLDSETKRRIDTCRDILVGKVPDPKSQVEQITIALIYKFMDDMDAEAEAMGGDRSFFTGKFAQYAWTQLMVPNMGGFDVLSLYSEAIQKMNENPGVPALFRDIFKNAYLPYRDPETLRSFLKEINGFTYDHSERLGDAFEYLLSVLGSQGEAGQFRTPRHIIDFMVEIIDPKKDETILDPACGTAGFLISSYKHILKHNTKGYKQQQDREAYDEKGVPLEALTLDSPLHYKGDLLTPDDKKRLAANIHGYDISPDMVRLSLVNMYLHGFTSPHIDEYDTLTSDEKWNELADVILANPPFMSPKGGIKPHKRFSVAATRSEVLFVDYIAEHLTPNGRAAVVVPEGIIFQSGSAYKQLREMLVKNYLVAVISLPAGVFNPYSGVKTSILIMDKRLAKKTDAILFAKIDNDGFNLGAQRRPIDMNDLPAAACNIKAWLESVGNRSDFDAERIINLNLVAKEKISENGEWNLSGERYREAGAIRTSYPLVSVGAFAKKVPTLDPRNYPEELFELWSIPAFDAGKPEILKGCDIGSQKKCVTKGDVLLSRIIPHIRRAWVVEVNPYGLRQIGSTEWIVFSDEEVVPAYLRNILISDPFHDRFMQTITGVGGSLARANQAAVGEIKIPLPPLEVQMEIVTEIEGYQKIINGARQVVENYQPHIPIHPEWPMVDLGALCDFKNGLNFDKTATGHPVKIVGVGDFQSKTYIPVSDLKIVNLDGPVGTDYLLRSGDILFVRSNGNPDLVGRSVIVPEINEDITFSGFTIRARVKDERAVPIFLAYLFKSREFSEKIKTVGRGANIRNLSQGILSEQQIALPDPDTQHAIVAKIEAEQGLVDANKDLIRLFEDKIKATINRVWSEASSVQAEDK